MTRKNMVSLRIISLLANGVYILYGIRLEAPPFIIGCSIAVLIHLYHLTISLNGNNTKKVR
ncbi:MAG: hypothetical protein AAFN93_01665 [Bacteroidota bacterium]